MTHANIKVHGINDVGSGPTTTGCVAAAIITYLRQLEKQPDGTLYVRRARIDNNYMHANVVDSLISHLFDVQIVKPFPAPTGHGIAINQISDYVKANGLYAILLGEQFSKGYKVLCAHDYKRGGAKPHFVIHLNHNHANAVRLTDDFIRDNHNQPVPMAF